jgi:hypothetical protein
VTDLPKHDDLYLPTLRVLDRLGGSASIEEIQQALTEDLGFTEDQLDQRYPKSGALTEQVTIDEPFFDEI